MAEQVQQQARGVPDTQGAWELLPEGNIRWSRQSRASGSDEPGGGTMRVRQGRRGVLDGGLLGLPACHSLQQDPGMRMELWPWLPARRPSPSLLQYSLGFPRGESWAGATTLCVDSAWPGWVGGWGTGGVEGCSLEDAQQGSWPLHPGCWLVLTAWGLRSARRVQGQRVPGGACVRSSSWLKL